MTPGQAAILGLVEGITEFLPISSTGHLILASRWMGLSGEGMNTFEVVIQAGALGAVVWLYRARVAAMARGLLGASAAGRRLGLNLLVSFLPAAAAGGLLHRGIKAHLFGAGPVIWALAVGGLFMIVLDLWLRRTGRLGKGAIESLTIGQALFIGLAQCLALWPGTSRAFVTLAAGLLAGLSPVAAAEYSFLLAIPTLGAAALLDAFVGGAILLKEVGGVAMLAGFSCAAVSAALAVQGLIRWLTRRGLAPFGWYRIGLAAAVAWAMRR